jgi:hypothetical protein
MTAKITVMGCKFGKLTPVQELPRQGGMRAWRLKCDCGGERVALQKAFASGGGMRSCGCDNRHVTSHGLSKAPEYRHWINMLSRCNNPRTPGFHRYGGRGISVCQRWSQEFANFYADMGERPSPKHSLDRIDTDGNYELSNCRWATKTEQARNTSTNRFVEVIPGEGLITLAEAVERAPVPYSTVLHRLMRGWGVRDAVLRPPQKGVRP